MRTRTEGRRRGRAVVLLVAVGVVCASPLHAQRVQEEAVDPVGRWALTLKGAFASQSWTLAIGREGGALTGTLELGTMGSAELEEVVLKGDTLRGHFTANMHGQEVHVAVASVIRGDGCEGEITGFPMGDIAFTGRRSVGGVPD